MSGFSARRVSFAIVVFGAGVATGLGAAKVDGRAHAVTVVPSETVASVPVELTRVGPNDSRESVKKLALRTTPPARPDRTDEPAVRKTPREIASRALGWTVFLHGGNVYGAGVVLDGEGHVLTCDHVIDGLDHVDAFFDGDSTPTPVSVVARAKDVDLALLKLSVVKRPSTPVIGSVARIAMGDEVFALGAPRKMTFSMSHGIVSYVGRSFDGTFYVQTDLASNDGSSGGPILDERGELVGVSSFILRGSQGLAFAVPIDYAYERFRSELGAGPDAARFDRWLASRKSDPDTGQR